MNNGTVKWFNAEKVLVSSKEKMVATYSCQLQQSVEDGYKSLEEGQKLNSTSLKWRPWRVSCKP